MRYTAPDSDLWQSNVGPAYDPTTGSCSEIDSLRERIKEWQYKAEQREMENIDLRSRLEGARITSRLLSGLSEAELCEKIDSLQSRLTAIKEAWEPVFMAYNSHREYLERVEKQDGPPIEDLALDLYLRVGDLRRLDAAIRGKG